MNTQAWITKTAREAAAPGGELPGSNGFLADYLVAKAIHQKTQTEISCSPCAKTNEILPNTMPMFSPMT